MCQALAVAPTRKYQSEGGPGAAAVAGPLLEQSTEPIADLRSFVQALAFNWFIGGTDAHAKNYALMYARSGSVRLAPLYDLASVLPYEGYELHRLKLAMKVGGKYRLTEIQSRHWQRLADEVGLREGLALVASLGERFPAAIDAVLERVLAQGLEAERAEACARAIRDWVPRALRGLGRDRRPSLRYGDAHGIPAFMARRLPRRAPGRPGDRERQACQRVVRV
ncbi:MAG: type II toxin-antitoxin system HipA family toxin [bacterium]|nr:type II toxin-antitoxin system HipA family toxin [bacterium]